MRLKHFTDGILKNNPVLVLVLGLCPTLAISTAAGNSVGMAAAVIFVLVCSNAAVSAIRRFVPDQIRIPIFIIVISTFVTLTDYVMHAYVPDLYKALGVFVPLIVVNCIILGRAEGFACRHTVLDSVLDGLGTGIGYTLIITMIGMIRELLGSGSVFGKTVLGAGFASKPVLYMILPPGGFLLLAFFMAALHRVRGR